MQATDKTITNASDISSSPFTADLSQYMQTQDSVDEKNQSKIIKWSQDTEKELDSMPEKLEPNQ